MCVCNSHLCNSSHHHAFSSFYANLHQARAALNPDVERTCVTLQMPTVHFFEFFFFAILGYNIVITHVHTLHV